ncbi:MAG: ribbon-helix-helix protein, CopG family [Acidimicrobiales bacterium]
MTKTFTHKGKPLTDERAEKIAAEALADLDAMSDNEARKRTRPPGSLVKRMGRPRVGGAEGTGPSTQVRVRVSGELLDQLDAQAARSHRSRSEIIRDAIEAHLRAS